MDAEEEEIFVKELLFNARLAMTLLSSIKGRRTCSMVFLQPVTLCFQVTMIVVAVFFNHYIDAKFPMQRNLMAQLSAIAPLFWIGASRVAVFMVAANHDCRLPPIAKAQLGFYRERDAKKGYVSAMLRWPP
jgi:hypothetical protein